MKRWLLLAAVVAVVAAAAVFAVGDAVDPATLRRYNTVLLDFVRARPVLAPAAYVGIYAAAVVASVPIAALFTAVGGSLFGWLWGAAYTLVAQMIGATALFLLAPKALAGWVMRRAGPRMQHVRAGFRHNAFSYIIVLRLTGMLPGFLVNAVPGVLGVRPRTYFLGSAIGLLPGTAVYTGIGAGVGSLMAAEQALKPANLFTPEIVVGFAGLVVLTLIPVAYQRLQKRRHA